MIVANPVKIVKENVNLDIYSKEYIAFVSPSSIEYALSDVLEYAYLDDLLPDGKEVEP